MQNRELSKKPNFITKYKTGVASVQHVLQKPLSVSYHCLPVAGPNRSIFWRFPRWHGGTAVPSGTDPAV